MRIKSNTLTQIFNEFRNGLDELGGLLGAKSKGNVIEFVVFDKGTSTAKSSYLPDVDFLNKAMESWCEEGIELDGMFVVYKANSKSFTPECSKYFIKMLSAMPDPIDKLYYLTVCPTGVIIPHIVIKHHGRVTVLSDYITTVE